MALAKPVIYDGGLQRQIQRGDVLAGAEVIAALTTVGAGTLTAALLISGILNRTGPVGAFNETTDTAANIIAALAGAGYGSSVNTGLASSLAVQNGTTFHLRYINTVAFVATLVAGAGVTLGANTAVAASSVKDFLITVNNGTPTQVFPANFANASTVVTGMSSFQTSQLSVGQAVSGTNIQAGSTVISIQQGAGVTLSLASTGVGVGTQLTFNPSVTISSLGQMLL